VKHHRDASPRDASPSRPDEIAMIQFSSGTTTDPKPVALTHSQMLANAERITASVFDLQRTSGGEQPSGVSWLPLYHDMGLVGCLLPALLGPGPLTLLPPELFLARPAMWLRAISRYRGTTSPAPNFAYGLCVDRIRDEEMAGVDLSCWRMAMNGAEPLSAETIRRFEHRFSRWGLRSDAMMPVYGLSEATLAVTFTRPGTQWKSIRVDAQQLGRGIARPDEDGNEWVSCGRPLAGFAIEIRDGAGQVLAGRRVGRIHVRGPSVMSGYFGRGDAPIADGWLDTGDLGFLDDGELYVTGRAKDMLVLRGQNHAPEDFERAVDRVAGVRTGCAAAVADVHAGGEAFVLFIEAREPREDLATECREAVLEACGVSPDAVVVLEPGTLPRTSSGKIRRGEALRLWKEASLDPPDPVGVRTIASAMVRSAAGYVRSRIAAGGNSV
jgi:acyl-CoA synthetase (AMP-forming)/AMP-acid ligase II